ncbi:hypothetical protein Aasi_1469 [Candidatus Amoebophilus asiaticus 5a2]|uniref:Uncharacterized protein n=1 Tax=Amoebophilus asiaticus (strain 5a2) TaxID=452471 RepID=C3L4C5_AMOA5|nr:hypothetical protein Aasi_1469 [Candidatus Amoebophilus asiaticus 5a2]
MIYLKALELLEWLIYVTLDRVKRVFGKKYLRFFHKRAIIHITCLILHIVKFHQQHSGEKALTNKRSATVEQD